MGAWAPWGRTRRTGPMGGRACGRGRPGGGPEGRGRWGSRPVGAGGDGGPPRFRGNVPTALVRRRHRGHAPRARGARARCWPQAADHLARAAPGADDPGPRVPLSRLSGAPLRRPSCPALGRGWGDPARQPGAALPASSPRGTRRGIPGHARPRRHGALLPARRPAAPGRATGPALGRSSPRADARPSRGGRHYDRRRDRAPPLVRRTPGRGLGDRRPLEAATDWGGACCR